MLYFYLECSDSFFDYKNNDYVKFDNKLKDLIFSNNSEIIKGFELYAISLISYHLNITDNPKDGLALTNQYTKLRCPDCNDSIDLFNKYIDRRKDDYSVYLVYALYYFVLNDRNNFIRSSPEKEKMIKAMSKYTPENLVSKYELL